MRNYLREAIKQQVREEVSRETSQDGQRGIARQEPDLEFRVVLRPIASSLPLGFFALTVGTVLLTALELHWVPVSATAEVAVLVLAFVVPLEALSGLFAFLARDSGAATGLTTLSAAWAATSVSLLHGPPGALSLPLAVFLLTLTALMLVMSVASVTGKPLFGLLLLIGACRFALTGVFQATGKRRWNRRLGGAAARPLRPLRRAGTAARGEHAAHGAPARQARPGAHLAGGELRAPGATGRPGGRRATPVVRILLRNDRSQARRFAGYRPG
jgi:succinate-acetate transporter protein